MSQIKWLTDHHIVLHQLLEGKGVGFWASISRVEFYFGDYPTEPNQTRGYPNKAQIILSSLRTTKFNVVIW